MQRTVLLVEDDEGVRAAVGKMGRYPSHAGGTLFPGGSGGGSDRAPGDD